MNGLEGFCNGLLLLFIFSCLDFVHGKLFLFSFFTRKRAIINIYFLRKFYENKLIASLHVVADTFFYFLPKCICSLCYCFIFHKGYSLEAISYKHGSKFQAKYGRQLMKSR